MPCQATVGPPCTVLSGLCFLWWITFWVTCLGQTQTPSASSTLGPTPRLTTQWTSVLTKPPGGSHTTVGLSQTNTVLPSSICATETVSSTNGFQQDHSPTTPHSGDVLSRDPQVAPSSGDAALLDVTPSTSQPTLSSQVDVLLSPSIVQPSVSRQTAGEGSSIYQTLPTNDHIQPSLSSIESHPHVTLELNPLPSLSTTRRDSPVSRTHTSQNASVNPSRLSPEGASKALVSSEYLDSVGVRTGPVSAGPSSGCTSPPTLPKDDVSSKSLPLDDSLILSHTDSFTQTATAMDSPEENTTRASNHLLPTAVSTPETSGGGEEEYSTTGPPPGEGLGAPTIVGISLGSVAAVLVLCVLMLAMFHRLKSRKMTTSKVPTNHYTGLWDDNVTLSYINNHFDYLQKDAQDEMISLDNDAYLNSLEVMVFTNTWGDGKRNTRF